MQAARLHAAGDLRIENIPTPQPGPGQALIQVAACGVCGSDIPRITTVGTYHFPTIPGHEFAGRVVQVGAGVDPALIGRLAAVNPLIGCGVCEYCRSGLPFHCSHYDFLGSRSDGGYADFVLVPARNLVLMNDKVSSLAASLLEPITVGLHAVRRPGIDPGDTVVVFGAGAIGLFTAQWANFSGAGRVIQVDIREQSLEVARRCGVGMTLNAAKDDIVACIMDLTGGRGADLAIEAAGSAQSTAAAFRCVRRRGRVSLIGRIDGDWTMPQDVLTGLLRKEQTIFGNWGFDERPFPAGDWAVAAHALENGRIVTEPLITHRFALGEAAQAIGLMAERREFFCKVMLIPSGAGD